MTSIINTTSAKKRNNFVGENKENNYSKILTPDNIDFEMTSSKMKESINNPLEAFDIEKKTLQNELVKVRSEIAAPKKILKQQNVISFKVWISMFFKMINFVTITLASPQI